MIKKTAVKKATAKKSVTKQAPEKKTNKVKTSEPVMQILKTSKCKTVSEKSELTYNIAQDEKGNAVIRIAANTGGGFWSREYVSIGAIVDCIRAVPEDQSVTSIHLFKLFTGKSQNTPGFLLAVLLKEGLLVPTGKKRQYSVSEVGIDAFLAKVDELKSVK